MALDQIRLQRQNISRLADRSAVCHQPRRRRLVLHHVVRSNEPRLSHVARFSCRDRVRGAGRHSRVSGHIRGRTNTLPLHIEILYNEYNFTAAFAVASILVILAIIVLILRNIVEVRSEDIKSR